MSEVNPVQPVSADSGSAARAVDAGGIEMPKRVMDAGSHSGDLPSVGLGTAPGRQTATGEAQVRLQESGAAGQRKKSLAGWGFTAQSLLITVVIAMFVITFVVQAFRIPSESMERTLLVGDYLLVDKAHYGPPGIFGGFMMPYRPVRRGDVVVFHYPVNPSDHFVKRVIGLPGDRIHLVRKRVYVNDKPLDEPYARFHRGSFDPFRDNFPADPGPYHDVTTSWFLQMRKLVHGGELTVPADSYFVLGDNRDDSLDSRYWGFVPRENIIGRPLLIYWSAEVAGSADSAVVTPQDGKLFSLHPAFEHWFGIRWWRMLRLVK